MKVFLYSAKQSSSRCTWLLEMNSRLSLVAVLRKDVREVLDVLKTGRLSKSIVVPEHGAKWGGLFFVARPLPVT